MKKNDVKALFGMDVKELKTKHDALLREYALNRIQHKAGRLKNVSILHTLRDDAARVLTVMALKLKSE